MKETKKFECEECKEMVFPKQHHTIEDCRKYMKQWENSSFVKGMCELMDCQSDQDIVNWRKKWLKNQNEIK